MNKQMTMHYSIQILSILYNCHHQQMYRGMVSKQTMMNTPTLQPDHTKHRPLLLSAIIMCPVNNQIEHIIYCFASNRHSSAPPEVVLSN